MENSLIAINDPATIAKKIFDCLDVSETTRQDYKYRIAYFLNFVKSAAFTTETFLDFKRHLEKRSDYTASTKNKYLATAKVFLKEAHKRGIFPTDITQNIKGFKQSKKHKKDGLNDQEVSEIVNHLKQLKTTPFNARLKVLFCLLAFQGVRQIEAARLDFEDINFKDNTAFIQAKGADDKEIIYLHPETVSAIKEHVKVNKIGSGALFKSLANRKSERLTTRSIKNVFEKIFNLLNIEKSTHGFRHFFITKLLQKFDVRDVRKFSRHKSLEMLIVYDDEIDIKHKSQEVFNCFQKYNLTYAV